MKLKLPILCLITILTGCSCSTLDLKETSISGINTSKSQDNIFVQCIVEKVKLPKMISPSFNSPAEAILIPQTQIPNSNAEKFEYHYEVYTSNGSDLIPDIKEGSSLTLVFTQDGEFIGRK